MRRLTVVLLALSMPGLRPAPAEATRPEDVDVEVIFHGASGETHTDADGTRFRFWGREIHDPALIYPEQYRGVFPLYFFGQNIGTTVRLTHRGHARRMKLRITTEAFYLKTDGSSGAELFEPRHRDVVIERGETVEIDMSFIVQYRPGLGSGLDRLLVHISHPNGGREGAARFFTKEAVFCPPEVQEKLEGP